MRLIELTGFGDMLRLFGVLYWTIAVVALGVAFIIPKTRKNRIIAVGSVLVVFGLLPASGLMRQIEYTQQAKTKQTHVATGIKRFQAYCQTAGVKIHRTVDGVEGVYLMKIRTTYNLNNQYAMDDPYGNYGGSDDYIKTFLIGRKKNGQLIGWWESRFEDPSDLPGYRFVEAIDPKDGKLYRFTAHIERPGLTDTRYVKDYVNFVVDREPITQRTARYGVTYDDISTKEDRDYWIAGSSLRVLDLETNEVIAERIGYMMDYGQGPDGAKRQGWTFAAKNACPSIPEFQAREFTEQSLHIAK